MAPAMVQVESTQEATGTPTCSLSLETQESEDTQEGTIHVCGQLRTEEAEIVKSYRQRHGGEGALEGLALHPARPADGEQTAGVKFIGRTQSSPALALLPLSPPWTDDGSEGHTGGIYEPHQGS